MKCTFAWVGLTRHPMSRFRSAIAVFGQLTDHRCRRLETAMHADPSRMVSENVLHDTLIQITIIVLSHQSSPAHETR